MTEEAAPVEVGVVLAALCRCELGAVRDEIRARTEVEVVELGEDLTGDEVDGLVQRLNGRRLAVLAEGTVGFDRLIQRLGGRTEPVPFALLPCPRNSPSIVVAGVPDAGDSGVDQLLDGASRNAGALRSDHGEFRAAAGVRLVRAGVVDDFESFEAHISVDGGEVFSGTVDGDIRLSVEFGRLHVETVADGESREWTGQDLDVRAGAPIEVHGDCVGKKPARIRHAWTVQRDGFLLYADESARVEVDVLLLNCGDGDVRDVLDELDGLADVEVVGLPATPSREEVVDALARARGRRVAVRAGRESFEFVVHHLRDDATPLAILPDSDDPVQLGPTGAPFDESGVAQLVHGTVAAAPVLRDEFGDSALSVGFWDAGPDEAAIPFDATIVVDGEEVFRGTTDGIIRISLDVVGDAEVEFAASDAEPDRPRTQRSGGAVVVESPTLLEAADAVEIKGTGHRHVWTVDPDGFDIYVQSGKAFVLSSATHAQEGKQDAERTAEQRRARRERLLAEPPPTTTSTSTLLFRIVAPVLLVFALSVAAFALTAFVAFGLHVPLVIVTGVGILVGAYKLSGKRAGDFLFPLLVCISYLSMGLVEDGELIQQIAMNLYGEEVPAVVTGTTSSGEKIITEVNGGRIGVTDSKFAEPGDHLTVVVDPNGRLDPLTDGQLNRSAIGYAVTLVVLVTAAFVKSGLTWRRQRRQDYADYLTYRDEEAEALKLGA